MNMRAGAATAVRVQSPVAGCSSRRTVLAVRCIQRVTAMDGGAAAGSNPLAVTPQAPTTWAQVLERMAAMKAMVKTIRQRTKAVQRKQQELTRVLADMTADVECLERAAAFTEYGIVISVAVQVILAVLATDPQATQQPVQGSGGGEGQAPAGTQGCSNADAQGKPVLISATGSSGGRDASSGGNQLAISGRSSRGGSSGSGSRGAISGRRGREINTRVSWAVSLLSSPHGCVVGASLCDLLQLDGEPGALDGATQLSKLLSHRLATEFDPNALDAIVREARQGLANIPAMRTDTGEHLQDLKLTIKVVDNYELIKSKFPDAFKPPGQPQD